MRSAYSLTFAYRQYPSGRRTTASGARRGATLNDHWVRVADRPPTRRLCVAPKAE